MKPCLSLASKRDCISAGDMKIELPHDSEQMTLS